MKKLLLAVAFGSIIAASCQQFSKPQAPKSGVYYGETFDTTHAVPANDLMDNATAAEAVVTGTVTQACKSEGCWVKLDGGNGRELFVSTEDRFTIPKEGMEGLRVYVKGETYLDSTRGKQIAMNATGVAVK